MVNEEEALPSRIFDCPGTVVIYQVSEITITKILNDNFPLKGHGWVRHSGGGGWRRESCLLFLSSKVKPQLKSRQYRVKLTGVFISNHIIS